MKSVFGAVAALLLGLVSCVSCSIAPTSAPSAAASSSAGGADCAGQKIRNKADFSSCSDACREQQRDGQRQCSDPTCLQGLGQAASGCFAKCEEGKKSAKTAGCYAE